METHTKKLHQIDYEGNDNPPCPFCGYTPEDNNHPFQCKYPMMRDAQIETINNIKTALSKINTYPFITETMIHYLQQWMGHSPSATQQKPLSSSSLHKNLQTAIQHQDEIGWDNFIRGWVAKKWYLLQKDWHLSKNLSNWPKKNLLE